jgi:polysaccharide deacetylase family sporulation protein PdaB
MSSFLSLLGKRWSRSSFFGGCGVGQNRYFLAFMAFLVLSPIGYNCFAQEVPKIYHSGYGGAGMNAIALTFDDGPHPEVTPRVLDILRSQGVRATFFVLGNKVKQYPEIARRIVAEGHQIANHSYSHPSFTKIKPRSLDKQVKETTAVIESITGVTPTSIRPPYGALNDRVILSLLEGHGLNIIMWNVDPQDWRKPGIDVVVDRVVSQTKPGAIILLHDIHKPTAEALPSILTNLASRGYSFATVDQLLGLSPRRPSFGNSSNFGNGVARAGGVSQVSQVGQVGQGVPVTTVEGMGAGAIVPAGVPVGVPVGVPGSQQFPMGRNPLPVAIERPMVAPPGVVHGRAVPVMRAEAFDRASTQSQ